MVAAMLLFGEVLGCCPAQEPKKVVDRYAAGDGEGEDDAGKAFVSLNWLLSEAPLDLETELAWGFLDYLLLEHQRRAPGARRSTTAADGEALIGARPPPLHSALRVYRVTTRRMSAASTRTSHLRKALNDSGLGKASLVRAPLPCSSAL